MRCRVVLALVGLSAVAAAGCGGGGGSGGGAPLVAPGGPFVPGVAYLADAEVVGRIEVFVASLDGSESRKVSHALAPGEFGVQIVWSPDGSRLLYRVQAGSVRTSWFVVDALGQASRPLDPTLGPEETAQVPVWSPDSSRIAYLVQETDASTGFTKRSLRSVAAGGGAPASLSGPAPTGRFVVDFAWSPDGTRVAFASSLESVESLDFEVFSNVATGGDPKRLHPPFAGGRSVSNAFWGRYLQWLPDSAHVLYVADQDAEDVLELFQANADGSGATKVSAPLAAGSMVNGAELAPEGSRVAYSVYDGSNSRLHVVGLSGGDDVLASDFAGGDPFVHTFHWAPDSHAIIVLAFPFPVFDPFPEYGLFVATPNGDDARPLVAVRAFLDDFDFDDFRWSPRSDRVSYVYASNATSSTAQFVNVIDPSDGSLAVVSRFEPTPSYAGIVAWAPDGSRLAFDSFGADRSDIEIADPDTAVGNVIVPPPLPRGQGARSPPVWTRDGASILFVADIAAYRVHELWSASPAGDDYVRVSGPLVLGGRVHGFALR